MPMAAEQFDLPTRPATKEQTQMDLHTITSVGTPPRSRAGSRHERNFSPTCTRVTPHTPPESLSGSPSFQGHDSIQLQATASPNSSLCYLPPLRRDTPRTFVQITLPSLSEFDQGVEDLARNHYAGTQQQHGLTPTPSASDLSLSPLQTRNAAGPVRGRNKLGFSGPLRRETNPMCQWGRHREPTQEVVQVPSPHQHVYYGYDVAGCYGGPGSLNYPSPPPDSESRYEGRHINKKYKTEEGDFIIYMWHDRRQKWQDIKKLFAAQFGATPERTVQGLQAWYYRMNQSIPVWDNDGWLVFENQDALEPMQFAQKCRERDTIKEPCKPIGLAQRYPERAINYSWVDAETKALCQDWAAKRQKQYHDRRQRRRAKEVKSQSPRYIYQNLGLAHERRRSN